ncbi:MAG: hypothetical protein LBG59_00415 [Candidatus Peribacteria bacterium]|nr:hypothetical protein [Candidatus Peribacteria bacterium]
MPESDLQAILVMDVKKFPESAELFLDPYEVARLDPYGKRHLEELALGNPLMKIRHQLGTVYDKLISSTNPKYSAFAQTFSEIVEQAEQAGTFSAQDIEAILGDAYRIYDKKDPLMVEIWQQLSTLDAERREVANKIEKEDNKKMFGKKFGAEVKEQPEISKPTTTPEKMGTLEQQMVNHILATNGKRVTQLKTTGFLDIEEGDKIQTHLTGAEKNELRPLAQSDITEVTPVKKTYQGEKYYIITCKIRGEPYTAIQVPNKLKKTKYQDTHMGRQLMKFKGNDWYPAFLTDEKLEKPLAQDRLIRKTEPAMQADGTPHTNIKLYTDGDPE